MAANLEVVLAGCCGTGWDQHEHRAGPTSEYNPKLDDSMLVDHGGWLVVPGLGWLVDTIYPLIAGAKGVGRRETPARRQLRLVLKNLYAAYDQGFCLAYPGSSAAYSKNSSRLGRMGFSRQFAATVKALERCGLVRFKSGFKSPKFDKGFTNRAWASPRLILLFEQAVRHHEPIDAVNDNEPLIVDNLPTSHTETHHRLLLVRYNELLRSSRLDCGPHTQAMSSRGVSFLRKSVTRLFADGDPERGGRLYGGFWQQIPREERAYIEINGSKTVELDYSGMHPCLLYGRKGLRLDFDPYILEGFPREDVKQAFLVCVNAASPKSAAQALRHPSEPDQKPIDPKIIGPLIALHEPIKEYFFSQAWGWLQKADSDIALEVIGYFTDRRIPVLSIHDSFVIAQEHEAELELVMLLAMGKILKSWGAEPKVQIKRVTSH